MPPIPVVLSTHRADNDYWRFDNYIGTDATVLCDELVQKGYHCMPSWTRERILKVVNRKDTSRVEYKYLEKDELVKFATDRSITEIATARGIMKRPNKAISADLRAALTAADDSPVFEKFLDLPAELRERIVDFYFSSFPETLHRPTLPPLARLSRSIKEEVSARFYKTQHFEIRFLYKPPPSGQTRGTLALDPESHLFLYQLSASNNLRIIRNLRLVFNFYSGKVFNFEPVIGHYANIDITLAGENGKGKIVARPDGKPLPLLQGSQWYVMPQSVKDCQLQLLVSMTQVIRKELGLVKPYQLKMDNLVKLVPEVERVLRATAERIK